MTRDEVLKKYEELLHGATDEQRRLYGETIERAIWLLTQSGEEFSEESLEVFAELANPDFLTTVDDIDVK